MGRPTRTKTDYPKMISANFSHQGHGGSSNFFENHIFLTSGLPVKALDATTGAFCMKSQRASFSENLVFYYLAPKDSRTVRLSSRLVNRA